MAKARADAEGQTSIALRRCVLLQIVMPSGDDAVCPIFLGLNRLANAWRKGQSLQRSIELLTRTTHAAMRKIGRASRCWKE